MRWWRVNPAVKKLAAEGSRLLYGRATAPVVVASSGRSGSTMLCHALMSSSFSEKYKMRSSPRLVFYPAFDVGRGYQFRSGGVYKTHLLGNHIPIDVKTIFIYDAPRVTYESYRQCLAKYGLQWGDRHLVNLESCYSVDHWGSDVDLLNYEAQLNSWMARSNGILVRFSDLWQQSDLISDYIGVRLTLPRRESRTSSVNNPIGMESTITRLEAIYSDTPRFQCM